MKLTIGKKIITATVAAIAISVAATVVIQRNVIRKQGIELTRETMRAALTEAESVRESISALNRRNAFDRPALMQELKKSADPRDSALYQTIPIVAAWNAIDEMAVKQGFQFRIPKRQARNPKNTPTADEEKILSILEAGQADEYFAVDEARNEIIYARPIVLSADCLGCHGDPKNSTTGDGKDIIGFPMEGWKTGETHGAFVLKASLSRVDAVVQLGLRKTLQWVLPIVMLIALGFLVLNRQLIVRPLTSALGEISEAAMQTAEASSQVAAASQVLAGGASEQAASLEETSASLEEISAMTKRNAESAQDAKALAAQTRQAADAGAEDMKRMSEAMADIKESSQNIGRIIKIIDEIAFQTNILALNAAVEAARAGDAGMGFAVVADEVRALAQRSAEAARQTASLIEDAIAKGENGAAICTRIASALQEIVTRTHHVDTLIASIATASNEQSQGLLLVNSAMSQLDQTTQSNAAATEECASTAAMLNGQAQSVRQSMDALLELVRTAEPSSQPIVIPEPTQTLQGSATSPIQPPPPERSMSRETQNHRQSLAKLPLPADRSFTDF